MKVLFLTEGVTTPSSRFRVHQFLPHFERAGITCSVRTGYDAHYNAWNTRSLAPLYKLACRTKRALHGLEAGRYDLVFVQRPAIPFTPVPEALLQQINPRILFDFDDHIATGARDQIDARRQRTLHHACEVASHIIAGNAFLAGLTAQPPEKTSVIPTVIDTTSYAPEDRSSRPAHTIGWMGTSGNFKYLDPLWPQLERLLAQNARYRVRLVSNAHNPVFDHDQVEQIPWSASREVELLRSFDVGIMPLQDSIAARGKCGFKMIQYMAVGTPIVASDVGVNAEIVAGSGAGVLVSELSSWGATIQNLLHSPHRRDMGQAGHEHILSHYSIQSVLPRYLELFEAHARNT